MIYTDLEKAFDKIPHKQTCSTRVRTPDLDSSPDLSPFLLDLDLDLDLGSRNLDLDLKALDLDSDLEVLPSSPFSSPLDSQ